VSPGRRDQRRKAFKQFVALHEDVGRAVAPGCFEAVCEATVGLGFESIEGHRGSQYIT
jgi:hypothetical protein